MKKMIVLLMSVMLLLLCGCGPEKKADKPLELKRPKEVVVLAAQRHLAPGNMDGLYCSILLGVWEPLITRQPDGTPAPCLAESWEMKQEGREWIFRLRKDVKFHNGTKFNADSVIKNLDRMAIGYKRSTFYGLNFKVYYPSILKYEKLDDYTVRLLFKENNYNQLYRMMDFGSPMYAPECFAADGNFKQLAIGTGPYKMTENVLGKYLRLQRNEEYYRCRPHIKEYLVKAIPNADVRYAALKAGEIDGVVDINAMPPVLANELKQDPRFELSVCKSSMIRLVTLNGKKYPFNDVRMRQAVSLALNRAELVKALYLNYASPTTNLINYTSPYHRDFPVEYNLEKAKKLAKEVLGDKRVEVIYVINGNEVLQKGEAELIAYWLKEIGLDVRIQNLEQAVLYRTISRGDFHIGRIQRGMPNGDPYIIFSNFMLAKGERNNSGYSNEEATRLLERVVHAAEPERRIIYDRLQEIAVEELPVTPLFNDVNLIAYNKRLKNYDAMIYGIDLAKVELVE